MLIHNIRYYKKNIMYRQVVRIVIINITVKRRLLMQASFDVIRILFFLVCFVPVRIASTVLP